MFLLDTCTLLWLAAGAHDQLSAAAVDTFTRHPEQLSVSAISALEIGLKSRKGKLELKTDPNTWFEKAVANHALHEIPVTGRVAAASTMLPDFHNDPCDRIIVATSAQYGLTILSPDKHLEDYPGVARIW